MHSGILKIGIYNEPAGAGIGGSENMVATLAESLLAQDHQVEILHRIPDLSVEVMAEAFGLNLDGVRLRCLQSETDNGSSFWRRWQARWRRHRSSVNGYAEVSKPYDIFIAVVHDIPPRCHAAKGLLIVLFPTHTTVSHLRGMSPFRSALQHPFHFLRQDRERQKRIESYHVKTAISDFSRVWTRRRWNIDCQILYPPVDNHFRRVSKDNLILSVGRFAVEWEGHTKKQAEMLASFRALESEEAWGWEYICVGGLRDAPDHHAFFAQLREDAAGSQTRIIANVEREKLKAFYERASIFWHAAGYGKDENINPASVEHFGISTVEAMAAGCVPVVINKGGQREIVQHGVNGFLWDELEQLKEYTRLLIRDEQLRARMAEAARARARVFSREEVVKRFLELLRPLLSERVARSERLRSSPRRASL